MIGLSDHWSSSITRLLMVVPLMLYGHLLIWWPCGFYARHLYGQVCGLKDCQLYDKPVILVLVSYPLIPSSYLSTMIGIMTICTSYDEDFLMPFMSHWMYFMSHVWSWPHVIHSFIGWSYELGFLSFSSLTSCLSLQKGLISLFGLLSSPSFWVLSLHFLVSSS